MTGQIGTWVAAFDHEVFPSSNANNHLAPFPNAQIWGTFGFEAPFNAIHMSVIPKGAHRGKVIVWNQRPVILKPGAPFDPTNTNYWSCQGWSIVDPGAGTPRFRNYLLPLNSLGPAIPDENAALTLFCSGHAWSPDGDLVVAGGQFPNNNGGTLTLVFRPDGAPQSWPVLAGGLPGDGTLPIYASPDLGEWRYGPHLPSKRYYPTVTMSTRLVRTGKECALVFGGGSLVNTQCPEWNSYEALVVDTAASPPATLDSYQGSVTFNGPSANGHPDELEEYPRMHVLSNGHAFMSGYDPSSADVSHETPPVGTATWSYNAGNQGPPASSLQRHDGATVLFAKADAPLQNLVFRLGGFQITPGQVSPSTATTEFLLDAVTPGRPWTQAPNMNYARGWLNAVILPDGSVLVVGGAPNTFPTLSDPSSASLFTPELFKDGVWKLGPAGQAIRDYHATAVLLPDGRVLVAGGNFRHLPPKAPGFDYEIFEPWYIPKVRPQITSLTDASGQPLPANSDGSSRLQYASPFQVHFTLAPPLSVGRVVLMAPGSITHHSDMSARYVQPDIAGTTGGIRTVTLPSEGQAPRGFYMLFVVTTGGVPSEATWVQIVN